MSDCTGCRNTQVLFMLTELLWDHDFLSDVTGCRKTQVSDCTCSTGLALRTGRKASLWPTFTTCFAASANTFLHLPIMYMYCVYPAMLEKSKTSAKLSENC